MILFLFIFSITLHIIVIFLLSDCGVSCFPMSGLAKTIISVEEGGNLCRKRSHSTIEQCSKRVKTDEMSANEKISNFSLISANSNGTIKLTASPMNKPGATTKKLVIKNFRSMFITCYLFKRYRYCHNLCDTWSCRCLCR